MSHPTTRSDGGLRRFVVHTAHETRDRGKVVRAPDFDEAALAFAEAWRPVPDADGAVRLVLTDLDSGERQETVIDVARPGVSDLQVRRARLEARAAIRTETPPGAERFAIGPISRAEPPMAHAKTPDLRRWMVNAAAALAVILVAAIVITQLIRDRMSQAPWSEAVAPAQPAAPAEETLRLRAAVLQTSPSPAPAAASPEAAQPAAAPAARPSSGARSLAAARPAAPRPVQPVDPGDGFLTLPAPDIAPEPLELPAAEPAAA
ncbi:DUF5961 family protein, partial [Phenylobacterium terrae]